MDNNKTNEFENFSLNSSSTNVNNELLEVEKKKSEKLDDIIKLMTELKNSLNNESKPHEENIVKEEAKVEETQNPEPVKVEEVKPVEISEPTVVEPQVEEASVAAETPVVQETIEETPAINEVSNEESTVEPELNPVLENTVQLPEVSVDAPVETNTPVEVDTPIVTETPIEESKEENTNSESFIDIADILNGEASIPTEETKIDNPDGSIDEITWPTTETTNNIVVPTPVPNGTDPLPVEPTNVVLPDPVVPKGDVPVEQPPIYPIEPNPPVPTDVPEPAAPTAAPTGPTPEPTLPDIPAWELEPIPLDTIPASVKTMDGKQRSLMLDNNEKLIEKKDGSNPAVMTLKQ